jgi:hypothetical protein
MFLQLFFRTSTANLEVDSFGLPKTKNLFTNFTELEVERSASVHLEEEAVDLNKMAMFQVLVSALLDKVKAWQA